MTIGLGLLLSWSPWLLGTLVLYLFYNSASNWRPAHHLIAIGCGSYVGHLTLTFLLYQLQAHNIPVFSKWLIPSILGVILAAATIGFVITKLQSVVNPIRNFEKREFQPTTYLTTRSSQYLLLPLVVWLTAIISFVAFEVALAPAMAWDTVWYWSRYAGPFVDHQLAAPVEGNVILSQRHPATVHLINSWSTFAAQMANKYWLYAPWLSIYIGIILTGIGICHLVTRNSILSFSVGILLATSAIPEAHAARAGYADLWVAGGIVASVGVMHLADSKPQLPKTLIMWALIAISLVFTKAAGLGHSIILLLAMVSTFFMLYISTRWKLLAGAASVLFSVFLLSHGWNTKIFGYEFSYATEANFLTLSRYSANLSLDVDFALLLNILFSSLVINSSFLLALVIPLAALFRRRSTSVNYPQKNLPGTYTGFLTALIFVFLILSVIISPQVSINSLPGQDTALTRFGQSFFFLAILLLITLIGRYRCSETTSVCTGKQGRPDCSYR